MMEQTLCASCEFCGDAYIPVVRYYVDGQFKTRLDGYAKYIGGEPVKFPARHCNHEKMKNSTIYEALEHPFKCIHYQKRTWSRPTTCGECKRRILYADGTTFCISSGYKPIRVEDKACINGMVDQYAQLSMF